MKISLMSIIGGITDAVILSFIKSTSAVVSRQRNLSLKVKQKRLREGKKEIQKRSRERKERNTEKIEGTKKRKKYRKD